MKFPLLLVLAVIIQNATSARILAMIIIPSYSHQMFLQPLWRELALRGHEMVVITTHPTEEKLPNFKEISIIEARESWDKVVQFMINGMVKSMIFEFKEMMEMSYKSMERVIALPQIQELIRNESEHFDLVILEHTLGAHFAFKHRFNCPVIGVVSFDGLSFSHEIMGNPIHRILYPTPLLPFHENLNFIQRVCAFSFGVLFDYSGKFIFPSLDEIIKKHVGDDVPSFQQLIEDTDMLFINANPLFSPVRPHTPSTISLAGGIHMKPPKPLPEELKTFLDGAINGVVYFSLGSNVKSSELPKEVLQTILETFSQIPYKVLFKFEDDQLEGVPPNVKIIKWAPQQDILRHKNVKLFVTQGGMQSMEEALFTHMPVVVMPFYGDQLIYAEKMKMKEMGLVVDRYNLNVEEFKAAIIKVIANPKYKHNIKERAIQIEDEPMKPLEKAVWWTEYVLRHKGAKHLKGPKIPNYQYFYLDVLAFLAVVIALLVGLLYIILKLTIKMIKYFFWGINKQNKKKTR